MLLGRENKRRCLMVKVIKGEKNSVWFEMLSLCHPVYKFRVKMPGGAKCRVPWMCGEEMGSVSQIMKYVY